MYEVTVAACLAMQTWAIAGGKSPPPAPVLRLFLLRALRSAEAPAPPYSPATAVTAATEAPAPPYSPAIAVTAAGTLAVAGAYRLCRCSCVVSAPTSVPGPAAASVFDVPRTQGALSPHVPHKTRHADATT